MLKDRKINKDASADLIVESQKMRLENKNKMQVRSLLGQL